MKINSLVKLGLMMLVLLVATGAAAAAGGSSYSTAKSISVPTGDIDYWIGTCRASPGDWYKFSVVQNDDCYIDLQRTFTTAGGQMKLHDGQNNIEAWVSTTHNDHYAIDITNVPRIQILKGTQSAYEFIAGRNYVYG